MIKPREYFAYRAYFAKRRFVTAAAAFEPSVVCLIPMNAILTLVAQNNDLAMFSLSASFPLISAFLMNEPSI